LQIQIRNTAGKTNIVVASASSANLNVTSEPTLGTLSIGGERVLTSEGKQV
jgi:hypothetical protein